MEHHVARLRAIFDEVIQAPAESRAALLTARCGADAALRRRLEAIIATAEADEPFLSEPTREKPPFGIAGQAITDPAGHRLPTGEDTGYKPLPHIPPLPSTFASAQLSEKAGTRIGPYKLLQAIGEGGFGVVFMAEQDQPVRRRVALKIIKLGMDTRQVVARFEQERQALALMDHPNIARVFDGGATDSGRPYFVMEYVIGDPITAFADAHKLSVRQRLDLFAQVCGAVQHAHTKGVIHRDIKPRNVLVSMVDGKPFAKVIDFGIAKATGARLTDKTLFTEHRQLIGTPEYMSPEQAEGSPDIDTRTDVYALGVLLYELLTGATPFDAERLRSAAYAEMQRIIKEEEPPAPSVRLSRDLATLAATAAARQAEPGKLGTLIKGELDWIVMKSLDKDRARRYETPNQLAADVQRHLSGEPVIAAPPSAAYRLRKFVRKHKTGVLAGSTVAAALMFGIAGITWKWREVLAQRTLVKNALNQVSDATGISVMVVGTDETAGLAERNPGTQIATFFHADGRIMTAFEASVEYLSTMAIENIQASKENQQKLKAANSEITSQRDEAEWNSYAANLALAQGSISDGDWPGVRERLAKCPERPRGFEWALLNEEAQNIVCKFPDVSSVVFSPDGTHLLTTSINHLARLWDLQGRSVGRPMPQVWNGVFSSDGSRVLTSPGFRTYHSVGYLNGGFPHIFDASTGTMLAEFKHDDVESALFNSDARLVLTTSRDKTARLWNATTGVRIGEPMQHESDVNSAAFSPDGTRVLTASEKMARLWDLQGHPVGEPMRHESDVTSVVFSPDGTRVLTASFDETARLWDLEGRPVGEPMRHEKPVRSNISGPRDMLVLTAFSPDGTRVLTASGDDAARLWDLQGRPVGEPMRHDEDIRSAVFSPDGTCVLTASDDKTARLWDLQGRPVGDPMWHEGPYVTSAVFSPDGTRVLTISGSDFPTWTARFWDLQGRPVSEPMRHKGAVDPPVFSPDGMRVLFVDSYGQAAYLADVRRLGTNRRTLATDSLSAAQEIEWSVAGTTQDSTDRSVPGTHSLVARSAQSDRTSAPTPSASSPDGKRQVVAASDRTIRFFDAAWRETATFRVYAAATSVRFSADGMRLILFREDNETEIWDARDIAARNADVGARWNEREPAGQYLDILLADSLPLDKIETTIRQDTSLPLLRRLTALEVFAEVWSESESLLKSTENEALLPEELIDRVLADERRTHRVRQLAAARVSQWWGTRGRPIGNAGRLVQASDCTADQARRAIALVERNLPQLASDQRYVYLAATVRGVAYYRLGEYQRALDALAEFEPTRDVIYSADNYFDTWLTPLQYRAMSHMKLGQTDHAAQAIGRIRDIVARFENKEEDEWIESKRYYLWAKSILKELSADDPQFSPPDASP